MSAYPLWGNLNKTTDKDIRTCKIPDKPRHEVELWTAIGIAMSFEI